MKSANSPSSRRSSRVEPLETRQLLSAVSPAVTALLAPETVGMQGVALIDSFNTLNRLVKPNPDAQSYLNLAAYTSFDVEFESLSQTLRAAPTEAQVLSGDADPMTIALPNPDGGFSRFGVYASTILAPELAAEYPEIRTFIGQGIDDPTATLAMDFTLQGFHAAVNGASGRYYIDPYYHLNADAGEVAYWTSDNLGNGAVQCLTSDGETASPAQAASLEPSNLVQGSSLLGGTLRTYRTAIAATGEYTTFQGGTVALSLSAITTAVVRLNQVYETDFAIRLTLVASETSVIYTSSSADPYNNPSDPNYASTTVVENQEALDSVIGDANYDIGHVFHCPESSAGNIGIVGEIGIVGWSGWKGQGYSSYDSPAEDNFVIDYVAHEIGHQFGGRHNFNRVGSQLLEDDYTLGVEPGSGQNIMSYAGLGLAQENILTHPLSQFNANNYVLSGTTTPSQILDYTLSNTLSAGYTSAAKSSTGNTPPVVSVDGSAFNIPISTPFALTATGSDANGDTLTYSWEQQDGSAAGTVNSLNTVGGITSVPSATATTGPVFRAFGASTNPTRTFPNLTAVLANRTYDKGERLPSVARSMKFAVVARDNRAGGGGVAIGKLTVTTVAGTAFSLSSFNSATSVSGGSTQTINWTNTNTGSGTTINAANVSILLSTDGGITFPITLASSTPNDGSQSVTMPFNLGSTTARIKIVPTNNIFFDINNANFTITLATSASATPSTPDLFSFSDTGVSNSDRVTKLNNSSAGSTLQFSVGNTVAGALVEVLSDGVVIGSATASGMPTTVTTNGTTLLTDGSHSITARQTESGKAVSASSTGLSVTVDTIAPLPTAQLFVYQLAPIRASFPFNEAMAISGAGTASMINLTTSTPASCTLSAAGVTATLSATGILDDGNYRATIQNLAITDVAGNSPASDSVQDFFFLNADANRDRFVDTTDFNVLAGNFGGTSKIFSQGNFNYDSAVDSLDFNLFLGNYGKRLASPAPVPAASLFAASNKFTPDRLEL